MTRLEVSNFLKKIKAYYPYFTIDSDEVFEEWATRLKPYDIKDLEMKLDEHLNGDKSNDPPKLHFLIRYLKTTKEKELMIEDPMIRCNLCGKEMNLSVYDNHHYEKCLAIITLKSFLKKEGIDAPYDELDGYSFEKIDKILDKYLPKKSKEEVIKGVVSNDK